jgi:nitrite reductase/ring-hydroxylating ferredoxin subunit
MIDLGSLDEFEEGKARIFTFEGREVGIVRWRGEEVYAVHNRCPHMGGPLCRGVVGPKIVSRGGGVPGVVEADEDTPTIICPWHKWEFQARSGESVWDPKYRVKMYPVKVEKGRVLLAMKIPRRRSQVTPAPSVS